MVRTGTPPTKLNKNRRAVTHLDGGHQELAALLLGERGKLLGQNERRDHALARFDLVAPDGSNQRRLTHNRARDDNPDWAPDGSRLVFQSKRHANWDLYTILPDGSGLERLTNNPAVDSVPAWSPDGTRIAFTIARYRSGREDIAVMEPWRPRHRPVCDLQELRT